jgi:hypothetical protein
VAFYLLWQTQQGAQHRETVIKFIEEVVVYKKFKTTQSNTKQHHAKTEKGNTTQNQRKATQRKTIEKQHNAKAEKNKIKNKIKSKTRENQSK